MILSIVIPIYNKSTYLKKCVDSIINQKYDDLEIILVDDGSSDDCPRICDEYQSNYPNIKTIHQTNQGLSEARNKGLSQSGGQYIWFIDADDYIEANSVETIVALIKQYKPDIIAINACKVYDYKNTVSDFITIPKMPEGLYTGTDIISISRYKNVKPCAPLYIYRREFLNKNKLKFYPGIYHEDCEFTPKVFCLAERVFYLKKRLYYLVMTKGSITRSVNHKKSYDLLKAADSLYRFLETGSWGESVIKSITQYADSLVIASLKEYNKESGKMVSRFLKSDHVRASVIQRLSRSSEVKYRIIAVIIRLHLDNILGFILTINDKCNRTGNNG